jgi:hypothetical protein
LERQKHYLCSGEIKQYLDKMIKISIISEGQVVRQASGKDAQRNDIYNALDIAVRSTLSALIMRKVQTNPS